MRAENPEDTPSLRDGFNPPIQKRGEERCNSAPWIFESLLKEGRKMEKGKDLSKSSMVSSLEGTPVEVKKIGYCRLLYTRKDGKKVIRHHSTDVLFFDPLEQTVEIHNGGWFSPTTKKTINEGLRLFGFPFGIYQSKSLWWIIRNGEPFPSSRPFFDGIILDNSGKILNPPEVDPIQESKRLLKLVSRFLKSLRNLETLPLPSPGDCWLCSMHTQDGKTLGEIGSDNRGHLITHLEESYIHGSLILNAMRKAGYQKTGIAILTAWGFEDKTRWSKTSVSSALSRYLKKNLNLATN
jgi:hypothetical protein